MADLLSSIADAGLAIRRIVETPDADSRFWQEGDDDTYSAGSQPELMNWHMNPRAELPVWLAIAAEKHSSG